MNSLLSSPTAHPQRFARLDSLWLPVPKSCHSREVTRSVLSLLRRCEGQEGLSLGSAGSLVWHKTAYTWKAATRGRG